MKKFLALALGLVLIGTTVITFSDASRDAYHAYLYQQALKKREGRRFAPGYRAPSTKTVVKRSTYKGRAPIANLRYPKNKRNLFGATEQSATAGKLRPMSNTIGFATKRTARETLNIRNLDPMYIAMRTFTTDKFSVEVPTGWNPRVEEGVLRVGDKESFAITVHHLEDVCENVNFEVCAITLSKNLNHLENIGSKINALGHISRLRQNTDRILGTNDYVQTHTESFLGTYFGRDVFISRYFVEEPGTDSVFVIETIANRNLASEAVVVTKRLTASFRMIIEE